MTLSRAGSGRIIGLVVVGVLAGGILGCAPEPEPTPTPTAAFASEEEAFAAAEEVYRAYIDASNAIDLSDPSTFASVEQFTSGEYQKTERKELSEFHAEGVRQTGAIEILWFHATASDLETVIGAVACNDVSGTDFIDSDGTSLVSADRPPRSAVELTFTISGDSIRLSESDAIEDDECVTD